MIRFSAISLFLFGLAGPASAQEADTTGAQQPIDAATIRRAIDAGNAAYIAAFQQADPNALSQFYDPRGSRLNEGSVVVHGRGAIAADMGIPGT